MTERHCLKCAHCSIDFGSTGYSEWTPGDPAEIKCSKEHWAVSARSVENPRRALAEKMEMARDCIDYREEP